MQWKKINKLDKIPEKISDMSNNGSEFISGAYKNNIILSLFMQMLEIIIPYQSLIDLLEHLDH